MEKMARSKGHEIRLEQERRGRGAVVGGNGDSQSKESQRAASESRGHDEEGT